MKKIYSIIISLIITLFIFISLHQKENNYLEQITIKRVIDGDTFVSTDERVFRLANINAPEKGFFKYEDSLNFLSRFVNKTLDIKFISLDNTGKREVIRLYSKSNYINLQMVKLGLVPKSWVEEDEIYEFYNAEKNAVENELGIWDKSNYYGCINISIYPEKEEVIINILCDELNLINWTIKDESREYLVLNKSSNPIRVLSGDIVKNRNERNTIFWKSENIWNNDRDTIYLFDSNNDIAFYHAYGYD